MATSTFNAQEIELRRKLLHEELANLEAEKLKNLGAMQVVDYHHPERSPGWPIYNPNDPRNKYPRLLYHPTAKDQRVEEQRLGLRRRNEANPHLAPMEIPPSDCLKKKVFSAAEEEAALKDGFVHRAPDTQSIDANSPAELIGRGDVNPLLLPMIQGIARALSVETIIALNLLGKEELVRRAKEEYGVELGSEATKIDIITAIQGAAHVANAS